MTRRDTSFWSKIRPDCTSGSDGRDREDVKRLARGPGLDVAVLRDRYAQELRFQLGRPDREDLTLQLWVDIIEELRAATSRALPST